LIASFRSYDAQIESPLPQDASGFEGNRNTSATRYHPRCIVSRRPGCIHPCAISVTVSSTYQLTNALHLLPNRAVTVDSVGIKLYLNRIRVEFIEINVSLKHMLRLVTLDLHVAEAQHGPFPFQSMPPIDRVPADRSSIGSTIMVGCRRRKVVLLGIFAHRAVGGETRR
jgi:hypothetical protein